jgi:hypothetical protein
MSAPLPGWRGARLAGRVRCSDFRQCSPVSATVREAAVMAGATQALDNFYLTEDELENTPSRKSGVDADTERLLRVYGADRCQRAVVLLKLPQVVAATAQTLLHRFYYKRCLRRFHIRVRCRSSPHAHRQPAVSLRL